jgi:hypothetical protein
VICDFCLGPDPRWTYPAAPMELVSAIFDATDDDWAVCDDCHRLLTAGDLIGLADRIVREHPRNVPPGSRRDGGIVTYPHPAVPRLTARAKVLRLLDARAGAPTPMR